MHQKQLFPTRKTGRYDVDLSHLELPEDEPLSGNIIESNRQLAYAVIMQALDDLLSKDQNEQRSAARFCLSDDRAHRELRMLWLGWLQMEEETLAKAANKRLEWLSLSATA